MKVTRPISWIGVGLLMAISGGTVLALPSEQLRGIVNSVDVEAKKIVLTPTDKDKPVDLLINDQTEITTEAGKTIPLKDLREGDGLGVIHTAGLASKIRVAVKPDGLTGHVKSVKSDAKTFVVTETGTSTDVTVAITPETSIVTTMGQKLALKDLKKGDGVGISHVNSVAMKVLVRVKPSID